VLLPLRFPSACRAAELISFYYLREFTAFIFQPTGKEK
jgi:hypothetical protein